jgi:iron complex outermembrane receptor protein
MGEIVVTAQKRNEKLSQVPISITAVDAAKLEQLNIRDLSQIGLITPGLYFNTATGKGQPYIRGIGTGVPTPGLEPPVAVYVDELYYSRGYLGILDLVDVGSVEVLRGPQGALYGRNATGGAILVKTADPTNETEGSFEARYGRFNEQRVDGVANVAVSDTFSFRIAGRYSSRDGFVTNPTNGDKWGGYDNREIRGKIRWAPTSSFNVVASVERYETDNYASIAQIPLGAPICAGCVATGASPPSGFYETLQGFHVPTTGYMNTATLRATLDTGAMTITSLTGYRDLAIKTSLDSTGTGAAGGVRNGYILTRAAVRVGGKDYSQELRAASNFDGALNFLAGATYFRAIDPILLDLDGANLGDPFPVPRNVPPITQQATENRSKTNSWSIYGEAYFTPFEGLKLTLGGRYSEERKKLTAHAFPRAATHPAGPGGERFFTQDAKFSKFTPRAVISYSVDDQNFYLSYNRGVKSGGIVTPSFAPAPLVGPETVDSIELGAKNSFLGGRLRTRLSAFYYFYKGIQVSVRNPITTLIFRENAKGANIRGAELEVDWAVTDQFTLSGGANVLHAKFKSYPNATVVIPDPLFGTPGHATYLTSGTADATGTNLPNAPKFSANLTGSYRAPIGQSWEARFTGLVRYTGSFLFAPLAGGTLNLDRQKAYTTANLSAEFGPSTGNWALGVYGDNVTGAHYYTNVSTNATGPYRTPAAPATYGVYVRVKY